MITVQSFQSGSWLTGKPHSTPILHAVTGEPVAALSTTLADSGQMLTWARNVGGPAMRALTFHDRARRLKRLAQFLMDHKEELYTISAFTGASRKDSWIDIEGGIGTLFTYASKGRRELPDDVVYLDGPAEQLSKGGNFYGRHLCVSLEGVAVHINAFNFPCWAMLEKLSTSWLAGLPAIVKPASVTSYLAEHLVRLILSSEIMPVGALQFVAGSLGSMLDELTCQDVVSFTGSAATGQKLRSNPNLLDQAVRFTMEADSLNFCLLGPDAEPGTPEFDLFISEVSREMTVKCGQKCTAIRRTFVPEGLIEPVTAALSAKLAKITIGDPAREGVRMGPLVGLDQRRDVRASIGQLLKATKICYGDPEAVTVAGGDATRGAFQSPLLLLCTDPMQHSEPHDCEAFGPVNTLMPYRDTQSFDDAIELIRRGRGSLVGSIVTNKSETAHRLARAVAPYHGRLLILDRSCAAESTGHGSPLPHLVHGGPGRAGGGEELGGIRSVLHQMQRTALQGSPTTLQTVGHEWVRGAARSTNERHPFRRYFDELAIGESLTTHRRTVTEADVVNFAGISGDFFYAHMDDIAAKESLFERRVAHGYFVLSAAAGLFVDPAPGPVLANYGLEGLRFIKPVYIGDTIHAKLTCKSKMSKDVPPEQPPQGVVAWDVEVINQAAELVAVYTILTLVKKKPAAA